MVYVKQIYQSPLGELSLVADEVGLVGIWFKNQKYFERGVEKEIILASNPTLEQTKAALTDYFAGKMPDVDPIPLSVQGTDFQKRVWDYLKGISYGQTVSYGEIAQALNVSSAQAIGGAVGKNPISILIPCHRVLAKNGSLTGYAAGLDKKIWLLEYEATTMKKARN
ncbi:methylated-DNA--[protein]-cysteine S-methyltransferase [Streptococcus pneumoniae]